MTIDTANPLRAGLRQERAAEPCTVVIFGLTGDLAQRKLVPALYNLHHDRLLPGAFAVVGTARGEVDDAELRAALRAGADKHSRRSPSDELWQELDRRLSYCGTSGPDGYAALARHLDKIDETEGTGGNRLFYLATPPSAFAPIVKSLGEAGLNRPGKNGSFARLVVEKPVGVDLESAQKLNTVLNSVFEEKDVYRIDHYLGKETVQNLLVFRFGNAIFEPLWNQKYIDHVQITVSESIGVEGRGAYFEHAGITRDIVQNHLLQLMCLIAMEPPASLDADAIRDEKVKVLQALRGIPVDRVDEETVRAQYAAGVVNGKPVPGYREEDSVSPESRTETYMSMRAYVDNWRWAGVPFYLRAGKRLPKRVTEVALQFSAVPHRLFGHGTRGLANTLALRIQPDEGITLKFESKVPGPNPRIRPVTMEFRYGTSFGEEPPEAYERLLLDAVLGDSTLFIRRDEVEESWAYIDQLYQGWGQDGGVTALPEYTAGTWGPAEGEVLLARDSRIWRRL